MRIHNFHVTQGYLAELLWSVTLASSSGEGNEDGRAWQDLAEGF